MEAQDGLPESVDRLGGESNCRTAKDRRLFKRLRWTILLARPLPALEKTPSLEFGNKHAQSVRVALVWKWIPKDRVEAKALGTDWQSILLDWRSLHQRRLNFPRFHRSVLNSRRAGFAGD